MVACEAYIRKISRLGEAQSGFVRVLSDSLRYSQVWHGVKDRHAVAGAIVVLLLQPRASGASLPLPCGALAIVS